MVNSTIVISDSPEIHRKESKYDYDSYKDHDYRGKIFIRENIKLINNLRIKDFDRSENIAAGLLAGGVPH